MDLIRQKRYGISTGKNKRTPCKNISATNPYNQLNRYSFGIYEITMSSCNLKILVGQSENTKIKNKKFKSLFSADHENVDEEPQDTVNFY